MPKYVCIRECVWRDKLWHVGDSPEDRAAAEAADLPCVLVRRS